MNIQDVETDDWPGPAIAGPDGLPFPKVADGSAGEPETPRPRREGQAMIAEDGTLIWVRMKGMDISRTPEDMLHLCDLLRNLVIEAIARRSVGQYLQQAAEARQQGLAAAAGLAGKVDA